MEETHVQPQSSSTAHLKTNPSSSVGHLDDSSHTSSSIPTYGPVCDGSESCDVCYKAPFATSKRPHPTSHPFRPSHLSSATTILENPTQSESPFQSSSSSSPTTEPSTSVKTKQHRRHSNDVFSTGANAISWTKSIPRRRIFSPEDMEEFKNSQIKVDFLAFIVKLSDSVKGKKTRDEVVVTPIVQDVLDLLDALRGLIQKAVPHEARTRFGNPAFREWLRMALVVIFEKVEKFVGEERVHEVATYLSHSFGHQERIDYGTGHEAHFAAFLYCLDALQLITPNDYPAVVLRIFVKYLSLMRELQLTYWLEPAGSHGIWGLDDYHFLPFLFGSSQLIGHKILKPKSIHNKEVVEDFAKDYIYFDCIMFVNSVKTESLEWHSPMLNDISGVKTWEKVNGGMIKMYDAEVLSKLPVMQHFLFGSILSFIPSSHKSENDLKEQEKKSSNFDHYHDPTNPNCCPRVPSAIAARQQQKQQQRIPLPMD